MNKITDRQAIYDTLLEASKTNRDIVVLCSDSRGSTSITPFTKTYPEQFVGVGVAEQNLISTSARPAACGKKAFTVSPACFLLTRSYEQAKIDVTYSSTNVILIGTSGSISYGALGTSHHSLQDIAAIYALPDMRVYLPSDRFQTGKLIEALLRDEKSAYVRVSRSAMEDIYEEQTGSELDKAHVLSEGEDAMIIVYGEMVPYTLEAARILERDGIRVGVVDIYCLKPLDEEAVLQYASRVKCLITMEERSVYGGLGSMVAAMTAEKYPIKVKKIALPDGCLIPGSNTELFAYYGVDGAGIAETVKKALTEG